MLINFPEPLDDILKCLLLALKIFIWLSKRSRETRKYSLLRADIREFRHLILKKLLKMINEYFKKLTLNQIWLVVTAELIIPNLVDAHWACAHLSSLCFHELNSLLCKSLYVWDCWWDFTSANIPNFSTASH